MRGDVKTRAEAYRTAIQNGYMDLAEKLIDSGSNLNIQDSSGRYSNIYVIQQG